jgi:hypothetical protein
MYGCALGLITLMCLSAFYLTFLFERSPYLKSVEDYKAV